MDRFRIIAIENLIKKNSLNRKNKDTAKKFLKEKINIYLQGLKKRKREKEIAYYQNKIKKYA